MIPGRAQESDSLAGTGLLEDVSALAGSLAAGDWAEAPLHGLGAGLSTAGAVIDPVGALASAATGWVMEHIEPLRGWLDDLAGDPAAVMADAGHLKQAGTLVAEQAVELRVSSASHLSGMEGHAVGACAMFARDSVGDATGVSVLLQAGAVAMRLASGIVDAVRSMVRDAIAEVVGMAVSSGATVAVSGGLVAPVVLTRISVRVSSLASSLGETLKSMARSFEALRALLARAESALEALVRHSSRRRPRHVAPAPASTSAASPTTWTSEMVERLASINPRLSALEVLPGAGATVVAGPDE